MASTPKGVVNSLALKPKLLLQFSLFYHISAFLSIAIHILYQGKTHKKSCRVPTAASVLSELFALHLIFIHSGICYLDILVKGLVLVWHLAEAAETNSNGIAFFRRSVVPCKIVVDIPVMLLYLIGGVVSAAYDSELVAACTGADLIHLTGGIKCVRHSRDSCVSLYMTVVVVYHLEPVKVSDDDKELFFLLTSLAEYALRHTVEAVTVVDTCKSVTDRAHENTLIYAEQLCTDAEELQRNADIPVPESKNIACRTAYITESEYRITEAPVHEVNGQQEISRRLAAILIDKMRQYIV